MSVQEQIKNLIDTNKVIVFMKGTPEAPQCGFSAQTIKALQMAGATPVGVNVLADPAIRQGIKDFTNWPTIPQVFIKGQFIGGCDIVTEMYQRGELKKAIDEA
ncbi:Grx4 family monothiol glutaredoxin [bacterium]|nr:Grx4 family monothiol glutaredoxin [bacterium]